MHSKRHQPMSDVLNSHSSKLISHTTMRLCSIVLEEVRNQPESHLQLIGQIAKQFFVVLFPNHPHLTVREDFQYVQSLNEIIFDKETIWGKLASENIAMESLQWKNNQKQLIRNILTQITQMLLKNTPLKHSESFPTIEVPKPFVPYNSQESYNSTVCSFKQIEQFIGNNKEQYSLTGRQRNHLEKILEELRSDRAFVKKFRSEKKQNCQTMWDNFGNLMNIQREKFDQTYIFEKVQPAYNKLLQELQIKNMVNQKIIKKYSKNTIKTSSKKQLVSLHSYTLHDCQKQNQEELEQVSRSNENKAKITVNKSPTACNKTNNFFKQTKLYSIKSKQRIGLGCSAHQWQKSTIDLKSSLINSKVEESFKDSKYKSLGKNILNNIVFDPDNMMAYTKRRIINRSSQKCLIRKFQKPSKTNRVLLRVGGIRLSLQQDNQLRFSHNSLMVN